MLYILVRILNNWAQEYFRADKVGYVHILPSVLSKSDLRAK